MVARQVVPRYPRLRYDRVDRSKEVGPIVDNVAKGDTESEVGPLADALKHSPGKVANLYRRGGLGVRQYERLQVVRFRCTVQGKVGGRAGRRIVEWQVCAVYGGLPAPRLYDEHPRACPVRNLVGAGRVRRDDIDTVRYLDPWDAFLPRIPRAVAVGILEHEAGRGARGRRGKERGGEDPNPGCAAAPHHVWPAIACGTYGDSRSEISLPVRTSVRAATASSSWFGFEAPTIGATTPGFCMSHASATCAAGTPRSPAIRWTASRIAWSDCGSVSP